MRAPTLTANHLEHDPSSIHMFRARRANGEPWGDEDHCYDIVCRTDYVHFAHCQATHVVDGALATQFAELRNCMDMPLSWRQVRTRSGNTLCFALVQLSFARLVKVRVPRTEMEAHLARSTARHEIVNSTEPIGAPADREHPTSAFITTPFAIESQQLCQRQRSKVPRFGNSDDKHHALHAAQDAATRPAVLRGRRARTPIMQASAARLSSPDSVMACWTKDDAESHKRFMAQATAWSACMLPLGVSSSELAI